MAKQTKQLAPLIYVDSDVYLDLVTRNKQVNPATGEPRWHDAQQVFDAVNGDRVKLAASALIEAEVGCNGAAHSDSDRIRKMMDGWFLSPTTVRAEVDTFLARDAVRLRKEHGAKREDGKRPFGGADATHLAAAVRLGCDFLFTHDGGLPIGHKIEGVEVLRPQIVWQESLFDQAAGGESVERGGRLQAVESIKVVRRRRAATER